MIKPIANALKKRRDRGYDTTYWAIDIHDTIVPATYSWPNKYDLTKFDKCLESLKLLSDMPDHKIILWSCTSKEHVLELLELLKTHGITIDYFNENPECESEGVYDCSGKFYFDILIEDKAGFDAMNDWIIVYACLTAIKDGTFS